MEYRIIAVQTIFGEERKRRLKLAFDIIWNLDIKKRRAGRTDSESQNADFSKETASTDEAKGESKEDETILSDAERKP